MHINSVHVERPLLRRTLRQALLLVGGSVLSLSLVSFVIARYFLLERAELHVTTLLQTIVDQVEEDLEDVRTRALETNGGRVSSITPVVSQNGLTALLVRLSDGRILSYPAEALLDRIDAAANGAGRTTEVLFGHIKDNQLEIIRAASKDGGAAITLGAQSENLALAKAVTGAPILGVSEDYRGKNVVAAARPLSTLNWGVTVQIDLNEVLQGVYMLAAFHLLIAIGILLLTASAALHLSKSWVMPIQSLAARVLPLGPGHWDIQATLQSRDETALLERVIVDMAGKLKVLYENLEHLIQERTTALVEQYQLDRAVLGTMEHAVIAVDASGKITKMNPAAEYLTGADAHTMIGQSIEKVLLLSQAGKQLTNDMHPVLRAMKTAAAVRPESGSSWALSVGSETKEVYLVATPLKTGTSLFGAVAVFQDVTKERQMEQLKSEFITLASHQLRTPLSIVQWQVETLRDKDAAPDMKEQAVSEVERATSRMTTITNALLQVAQLEGGALTPSKKNVDLVPLIKNAIDGVIDGNARHLRVDLHLPQQCSINTDPVLLEIVLQNLLENAVKYSPEQGTITIDCKESDGKIGIRITDQGMGIPTTEQRHVFEKFFRGSNVKKQSTDGTGLGLYIAKMILAELSGAVSFESKEGKGTTFIVTLS